MFLEDSTVGREVCRESHTSLLNRMSELFPVVLQQESLRDGPLCYITVKVDVEQRASWICCMVFVTDLRTAISPGVFADISAVVHWGGSSGVGERSQQHSSADDPAGSHGHYTWTGMNSDSLVKKTQSICCNISFVSSVCVSWLAVLQQRHLSFGGHRCGHADQHMLREFGCRSCSLESSAGLSLRYVVQQIPWATWAGMK